MHDGNTNEANPHGGKIMSGNVNEIYTKEYYKEYLGAPDYFHNQEIIGFFKGVAEEIKVRFSPKAVLDVGCACGHLVKALREIGIDAWGVDGSRAAIEAAEPSIKKYLNEVQAPFENLPTNFPQKYDLVISIETFEHFPDDVINGSVTSLCKLGDRILFSSTPWAYGDPTHINVHLPSYWARLFASRAFAIDPSVDASFVSPQAICFRKCDTIDAADLMFSLLDLHIDVNHKLGQSISEWSKIATERLSALKNLKEELRSKEVIIAEQNDLKKEKESILRELTGSEEDRGKNEDMLQESRRLQELSANKIKTLEDNLALTQKTLVEKESYITELLERENLLLQEIAANKGKELEQAREYAEKTLALKTQMSEEKEKLTRKLDGFASELDLQEGIVKLQMNELENAKEENVQKQKLVDSQGKELNELRNERERILGSRSYKLALRIKRVYHFFKKG